MAPNDVLERRECAVDDSTIVFPVMGWDEQADRIHAGYGACTKCNCKHYEGNDMTCANQGCGHAFVGHW
jgi:hypothetical protein